MSIAYYQALLQRKLEEVRRLNACRTSLEGKQQEFYDHEHKCLEPTLSHHTWHGTHAMDFQDIREGGIQASYLEIATNQFSRVYEAIANKIASLQQEISQIRSIIARLRARD